MSEQAEDQAADAGCGGEPERAEEAGRHERADHEDLAVGEVDQLDDPVDERVAERHERPDGAVREAVDDVVAEAGEAAVLADVLDAVGDRQHEEERDQPVLADVPADPVPGVSPDGHAGGFSAGLQDPPSSVRIQSEDGGRPARVSPPVLRFRPWDQPPAAAWIVLSNTSSPSLIA